MSPRHLLSPGREALPAHGVQVQYRAHVSARSGALPAPPSDHGVVSSCPSCRGEMGLTFRALKPSLAGLKFSNLCYYLFHIH